jgi:hypothetical protein
MRPRSAANHRVKQPVDSARIRRLPRQFGMLDRRLVYQKHICAMSTEALALYAFLECVSDPEGLSFYSDGRICEYLNWSLNGLWDARERLVEVGFLLYRRPVYQLLELPETESCR